jgi:hypothetical protein
MRKMSHISHARGTPVVLLRSSHDVIYPQFLHCSGRYMRRCLMFRSLYLGRFSHDRLAI